MYGLNDIKKYEEEKKAQQPSPMPGVAPALTPAAPVQEVPKETGLQQQRREELRADMAKPLNAPPSMGDVAFNNTAKPVLEKWDLDKMAESQRNNYMQSFDTWAEAEKRGDISQQAWANAKIQQMIAEGKNPGEYLNMLALVGSAETPEQKRKRERREALGETFRGLGNLIGNVANLYYTHRGGQYIDLNSVNEKHRERMEKIKEKQDALAEQRQQILLNAKMGDIKNERAERALAKKTEAEAKAKAEERAWTVKYNALMKELDNTYRMGQIDAQTKARLAEAAIKATSAKELEDYRQKNREALAVGNHERIMEREEARGGGSKATIRVPRKDGKGYDEYQKNDLNSPIVVAQIYHSLPETYRKGGEYTTVTLQDMQAAIGKALVAGDLTEIAPAIKVNGKKSDEKKTSDKKGSSLLPGSGSTSLLPK